MAFLGIENGNMIYGTEYSGRYFIMDSAPSTWHVWAEEDYLDIKNCWNSIADEMNLDPDIDWQIRKPCWADLKRAAVATFKTRREARAYVESIGGTWK